MYNLESVVPSAFFARFSKKDIVSFLGGVSYPPPVGPPTKLFDLYSFSTSSATLTWLLIIRRHWLKNMQYKLPRRPKVYSRIASRIARQVFSLYTVNDYPLISFLDRGIILKQHCTQMYLSLNNSISINQSTQQPLILS